MTCSMGSSDNGGTSEFAIDDRLGRVRPAQVLDVLIEDRSGQLGPPQLLDVLDQLLCRFDGTLEPDLVRGRRWWWRGPAELLDEFVNDRLAWLRPEQVFDMLDELLSRFYGTFEPDLVCGRRQRWRGPVELLDELIDDRLAWLGRADIDLGGDRGCARWRRLLRTDLLKHLGEDRPHLRGDRGLKSGFGPQIVWRKSGWRRADTADRSDLLEQLVVLRAEPVHLPEEHPALVGRTFEDLIGFVPSSRTDRVRRAERVDGAVIHIGIELYVGAEAAALGVEIGLHRAEPRLELADPLREARERVGDPSGRRRAHVLARPSAELGHAFCTRPLVWQGYNPTSPVRQKKPPNGGYASVRRRALRAAW